MGLIFDIRTAKLYENWCQSPKGRAMDKWMESAIRTLLLPRSEERVLDIGCGDGNHLLFFNKLGLDITGIDASPCMVNRAKERLGHRCTLKQAVAEDLPFEDNAFDLVIMINTLEFLDSPMEALREAGRVARRSVFVGALNSLSCYSQRNRIQGLFNKSFFRHARLYNLWELKSQVRSAYGDVPMAWRCSQVWTALLGETLGQRVAQHWALKHCPFGPFLALSADIQYLLRTEGHPLKVRLKKAGHSVADGLTMDKVASIKRKGFEDSRIQGFE